MMLNLTIFGERDHLMRDFAPLNISWTKMFLQIKEKCKNPTNLSWEDEQEGRTQEVDIGF